MKSQEHESRSRKSDFKKQTDTRKQVYQTTAMKQETGKTKQGYGVVSDPFENAPFFSELST